MLPPVSESERPLQVTLIKAAALIGDFVMSLIVGAMLRFRARSVFNAPPGSVPAAAMDCYAQGVRRVPWLLVTEVLRNDLKFEGLFRFVPESLMATVFASAM